MEKADQAKFQRYLTELSIQLSKNDYFVRPELNGHLSVHWQDALLCRVESIGGNTYRNENIATPEREAAKDRAYEITQMVAEYMRQLEQAPRLKAADLKDRYKLLADFNGTVLAAQETKYGVHFVTWDWDFNRKGLSHGHTIWAPSRTSPPAPASSTSTTSSPMSSLPRFTAASTKRWRATTP